MPKKNLKMQTWQFFHAARRHLSPERVTSIFGKKNARTAYLWAQDPAYTEDRSRDPLESMHLLFSRLDEIGRGDIVRVALEYLSGAVGADYDPTSVVCQSTIQDELLLDYAAVTALQKGIVAGVDPETVRDLVILAKEEIDRTYAKYLLEKK